MNKAWIEVGHHDANIYRYLLPIKGPPSRTSYCLFIIGLFETSWMIFDHNNHADQRDYGYRKNT